MPKTPPKSHDDPYVLWLATLDADEFENERYTITEEAEKIGMPPDESADKRNACEIEAHRRAHR